MKHILRDVAKSTFVVLLIGVLVTAANAQSTQPTNLYEALKDQNIPSEMKAQDLTADWHVVTAGTMNLLMALSSSRDMPYQSYYYTEGKTFPFGKQSYLVAYHTRDKNDFRKANNSDDNESVGFLLKDAVLSLSLLPLNDTQSIHEVKQFDPQTDFLAPDLIAAQDSVSNLKQIALAVLMYTQDYDEKIPPMVAARSIDDIQSDGNLNITEKTTVQTRLQPYIKNREIFLQPETRRPYLPNYKISRKGIAQITSPTVTFLFYEDAPSSDGKRAVAYLDGHVARIEEDEFQRQREAQGISASGFPSAMKPARKS